MKNIIYVFGILILLIIAIEDLLYKEVLEMLVYILIICGCILVITNHCMTEILTYIMCGAICIVHSHVKSKDRSADLLVIYGCLLIEGLKNVILAVIISMSFVSVIGLFLVAKGRSVKYRLPYIPFLIVGIAIVNMIS